MYFTYLRCYSYSKNKSLGGIKVQKKILKALARCGVLEHSKAIQLLKATEDDLSKLEKSGKISRIIEMVNGKSIDYYVLSEVGEEFLKEIYLDFGEIYRGFILNHDLVLSDYYLNRTEEEQETWQTRDDMIKKYKLQGTLDGAYINENGEFQGVEVLKTTAKKEVVERLEKFISSVGIQQMYYILYNK